ncbi:MAG: hypothetical protein ACRC6T_06790, partial [Sarcina sp.]
MNYKVKFSDIEKNIFNTVERDNMRLSAMSVYGVMINSADENGICTLSYKQIMARTKRKYKMVSSMLKRRIDLLAELGLIKIIKEQVTVSKQRYSYEIVRKTDDFMEKNGKKNEKENRKGNEVSNFESIEDTSFIDHAPMQKTKSKENLYNTY